MIEWIWKYLWVGCVLWLLYRFILEKYISRFRAYYNKLMCQKVFAARFAERFGEELEQYGIEMLDFWGFGNYNIRYRVLHKKFGDTISDIPRLFGPKTIRTIGVNGRRNFTCILGDSFKEHTIEEYLNSFEMHKGILFEHVIACTKEKFEQMTSKERGRNLGTVP